MAELWKPQTIEIYKSWVDAIENESSDELNDWEQKFIGSLQTRLLKGNNLTEMQAEKLEEMYVRYTN